MSRYLKHVVSKLTPQLRQCLDSAANLAVRRTHHEVEIEHLLMALFEKQMPMMEQVCRSGEIDPLKLLEAVQSALTGLRSGNHRPPVFSVPLSDWLENSWMYASSRWETRQISPQALLATLVASPSLQKLLSLGLQQLLQTNGAAMASWFDANKPDEPAAQKSEQTESGSALKQYTHHLTQAARDNQLDPVVGREQEIRQLIDILLRRRQNNPLLAGDAGVGKTALIEGLSQRIVAGQVPAALASVEVFTLDMGLLQAGASVKGEFENRLQMLLDEVKRYPAPIVLFIDEAHTLVGAGRQAGQNDAANLLKPALARGELRTIAATTWAEYKKYFEKDAALARRFQVINVAEPSQSQATAMLRAMVPAMEKHHGVRILDEAIVEAVKLSSRYITGRQLPDKSISLLDTACARVTVSQCNEPAPIEDLRAMQSNLAAERVALQRERGHEVKLQQLQQREAQLKESLARILPEYETQRRLVDAIVNDQSQDEGLLAGLHAELHQRHRQHAFVFAYVDAACVADVVSGWTGIPLGRMVENERDVLGQLAERLGARVMGQQHALNRMVQQIRIAKVQLADPVKPTGVFMLTGPSGVGKTETALALAQELYGGEHNLISINMSEYQEAHSVSGLKGAPPGYVGYGQGGILTEAVRRQPYSVILLDEVEKAHHDVLELFFQVFDKGMLEDAEGQQINFRNTLIILTTNVASDLVMLATQQGVKEDGEVRPAPLEDIHRLIQPELQRIFTPAFLGRLQVIPYLPVQGAVLLSIVRHKLDKIVARYRLATEHQLSYSDELVSFIAQRCLVAESGAREIDNLLSHSVLPLLSDKLLLGEVANSGDLSLVVEKGEVRVNGVSLQKYMENMSDIL